VSRRKLIPAGGGFTALAVAVAATLVLAGCGVSTKGDFDRGKQLFAAKCSQCHTLKDAGSTATIGPDLDAAFAQARAKGMDPETISGVVKNQVENPRPSTSNPAVSMPADLVTGSDLDDVASYLGAVAGNPEIKGPKIPNDPGARVFVTAQPSCSGCHTLSAVGASGTVGPDLDKAVPMLKTAGAVKTAIVDPDKTIAKGFPKGVMPDTFGQSISPKDLDDLVQFLLSSTASGAKGGSASGAGSAKSGGSSESGGPAKSGAPAKSGGSSKAAKSKKSGGYSYGK
jgi:mono/diheme cytochrome c family protein